MCPNNAAVPLEPLTHIAGDWSTSRARDVGSPKMFGQWAGSEIICAPEAEHEGVEVER